MGGKSRPGFDCRLLQRRVEVGDIAYGFMGSKALFAGLHADIFDIIAQAGPQGATAAEIEAKSPASGDRVPWLQIFKQA